MRLLLTCLLLLAATACGEPDGGPALLPEPGPDNEIIFGCPSWPDRIANPTQTAPETYDGFARPFFDEFCVRCHSVNNVTEEDRNFAPEGFNWDDRESVYEHLDAIRGAVGELNYMPPEDPLPTCEERLMMLRWIDVGAP